MDRGERTNLSSSPTYKGKAGKGREGGKSGGKGAAYHGHEASRQSPNGHGKKDRLDSATKEKPVNPEQLGLGAYATFFHEPPNVPEAARYAVRDHTAERVVRDLGAEDFGSWTTFEATASTLLRNVVPMTGKGGPAVSEPLRKQLAMIRLFVDDERRVPANPVVVGGGGAMPPTENFCLLGKADCIAVPAKADFDAFFRPIQTAAAAAPKKDAPLQAEKEGESATAALTSPAAADVQLPSPAAKDAPPDPAGPAGNSGWFWLLHAGAPNIGEGGGDVAEDFIAYSVEERQVWEDQAAVAFIPPPADDESLLPPVAPPPVAPPDDDRGGAGGAVSAASSVAGAAEERPSHAPVRQLDEEMYLAAMRRLWTNTLNAMSHLGVEEAVLFPFGMGAFIRHLGLLDVRFTDELFMRQLRRHIADQLMEAIASVYTAPLSPATFNAADPSGVTAKGAAAGKPPPPKRLHLCLMCSHDAESIENHNAFVESAAALMAKNPQHGYLLRIHRNVDALQLAHDLAGSLGGSSLRVGLLNGANRKLLGNHWFTTGARKAIDENLHRRSSTASRAALLLNMGTQPAERRPDELAETVRWLGGDVVLLNSRKAPKAEAGEAPTGANAGDTKDDRDLEAGTGGPAKAATKSAAKPGGGGGFGCCKRRAPAPKKMAGQAGGLATTPAAAQKAADAPAAAANGVPAKAAGPAVAPKAAAPAAAAANGAAAKAPAQKPPAKAGPPAGVKHGKHDQ